jgi:hypothetical protein
MTAISTPSRTTGGDDYPLTFAVDYPDRNLNRLSTAFRILAIIPIAILAGFLEGAASRPPPEPPAPAMPPAASESSSSRSC